MRTLCLTLVGVVVGWAASGVDWTLDAVGQGVRNPDADPLELSVDEEAMLADELHRSDENTQTNDSRRPQGRLIPITHPGRYSLKVQGTMGYYVIDSLTGRVWYGTGANRPNLIAAELPQK